MLEPYQLTEQLSLDPHMLQRDLDACLAAGSYYREMQRQNPNNTRFAATMFRRAAAHGLLYTENIHQRDHLFNMAAIEYQNLEMPYAYMLYTLIRPGINDSQERFSFPDENSETDNIDHFTQQIYLLLASLDQESNQRFDNSRFQLRGRLEAYRHTPIGVLGIAIGNYLDLYDALHGEPFQSGQVGMPARRITIDQVIQRFLLLYENAVRQARANQYHWQRLAMPFHPAEPDIFSVLVFAQKILNQRNRDEGIHPLIFRNHDLSDDTQLLLSGILDDYL